MARARATPASAWTHDARNRVAVGRGVRLRYVSRADVKFMHDEIFERECYGCAAIADGAKRAGVVIDVGANVGLSALWFAARSDACLLYTSPSPRDS